MYRNGNKQPEMPVCKTLKVQTVIGDGCNQIISKKEIEFPEPVKKIAAVDTEIENVEVEVLKDKVVVEGVLHKQIYYVTKEDQELKELSVDHEFNGFVEVKGARPGMTAEVDVDVEHVNHRQDENECDFEQEVILKIYAEIIETKDISIVVDVPGANCEKEDCTLQEVVAQGSEQIIVQNELEFPRMIRKIVSTDAEVRDITTEIIPDKVVVKGTLHKQVFYVASETNEVFERSFDEPFEGFVSLPCVEEDDEVDVDVIVEKVKYDFEPGEYDVKQTAILRIEAKAVRDTNVEIVTGIVGRQVEKVNLQVQDVIGRGVNQLNIKNEIELPRMIKKVMRTHTEVRDIETEIIHNKVIVDGVLHKQIYYVEQGTGKVFETSVDEKFSGFVEVAGAEEGMQASAKVEVEHVSYDFKPGDTEIEQTAILKITVKVFEEKQLEVMVTVCEKEPEEVPDTKPCKPQTPSVLTYYVVQPGDTLYKIAKRYGTTVEAIVAANMIKNPDLIFPGQKILIPKPKN